jgi:outer membrane protein TolC
MMGRITGVLHPGAKRVDLFRRTSLLSVLICLLAVSNSSAEKKQVTIAILIDGPGQFIKLFESEVKREITELLAGEFEASFPDKVQRSGDWSFQKLILIFEEFLSDPEVDLVVAIGTVASSMACMRKQLPKPVLATMVMAQAPGIPIDNGRSGRKNLNYLSHPWLMESDIKVFRQIYPFRRLAFMISDYVIRAESDAKLMGKEGPQPVDLRPVLGDFALVRASQSALETLDVIPEDVDAVYVAHLFQMNADEQKKLAAGLIERKLPSFSMMGPLHVKHGMLAARRSAEDMARMSRQVAINVQRILLGEDAGQIPVLFTTSTRLVLNARTVRAIGISPPFKVLLEAEMLYADEILGARTLTYQGAVEQALTANLELALAHHDVLVGAEEQDIARADLLPGLNFETRTILIDSDRAEASFGAQPEFDWNATLTFSEVIAEQAFANHTIQGFLQKARQHRAREIRLDIIEATLVAYINVLRARISERIQINNMRVSRANLELAKKRILIGASTSAEVYRWESVIARQHQEVIDANRIRRLAEMEMNRILMRPLEETFNLEELTLEDDLFGTDQAQMAALLDNPRSMKLFRDYLAKIALKRSPELTQLAESKAVIERSLDSLRRSIWLPSLVMSGQMGHRIAEAGQGTEGMQLPPEMSGFANLFPGQDDTTWSVGLSLSWPLFEGGRRYSKMDKLYAEHARLLAQIENVKQLIEQRMRTAMRNANASGVSILLSRTAAESAHKSLELVTDAYSRGALSIVDLLDAQNAALQADLASANAKFAYMTDLIRSQRASGDYFVLRGKQAAAKWINDLKEYLKAHDALPPAR